MEEHDKIELRHEDVQEILGTPPSWIIRWGTTVVLVGIALLFLVGWIIKYPDLIHAPVSVTTEMPPVAVVARTTGYLSKLLVKENDTVHAGDLLVVLQSSANYQDVLDLEKRMADLEAMTPSVVAAFKADLGYNLGELQLNYSAFAQILKELQFKKEEDFVSQTVGQYESQIKNYGKLIKTEKDKLSTAEKNLQLAKSRFTEKQKLYMQNVISRNDLEDAKKEEYRYEQDLKNIKSTVEQLNGQILGVRKSILDVQQQNKESNTTKYVGLIESLNQLKSAIQKWKQTYLLAAPSDGRVSFFNNYWAENQNIREGATVMAIVPPAGSSIIGMVELPLAGSGKVREGQRVVMKFDSYPYDRFGFVQGVVLSKALLPRDNRTISVRVALPNRLKTSRGFDLKFDQQMLGSAEIITEERRFVERMFDKLISVFQSN
ncbi:MAG: HlyD family efflux transporter periplasmic adaptor subunit [Saprospiraceae bacterium]|nr:HlyD family efflux transporter periplasmic adaptor subunit [Saprospiraceae bacterium]